MSTSTESRCFQHVARVAQTSGAQRLFGTGDERDAGDVGLLGCEPGRPGDEFVDAARERIEPAPDPITSVNRNDPASCRSGGCAPARR